MNSEVSRPVDGAEFVGSFEQTVTSRRSIRGYKPYPVPKAIIDEIVTYVGFDD